jgi:HD superfamily phosphohydrolase
VIDKLEYCGEIRDPIHGLIDVTEIEFAVMNAPEFQRLRRIKQLALADLGFHGAVHNRFGHSVGVMHVASKMAEHLMNPREIKLSKQELQDIRLAALLHDIGHGPFSHISEYLLQHFKPTSAGDGKTEEIHEEISHCIIRHTKSFRNILGEPCIKRVLKILSTEASNADFKHDLVSGPLDADKMDYLLRDSYFTGVKYGVFDLDRLINVLTVVVENKKKRLAARLEGVQAVEQYVLAKYFIAHQVYQHKTRQITDKMITEGVIAAVKDGNSDLKRLYCYSAKKSYVQEYLKWDDEKVFQSILGASKQSSKGHRYFLMLRNRELLSEIANCKVIELGGKSLQALQKIDRIKGGDCDDLLHKITKQLNLKPGFTHVLPYSLKVPLIQRRFGIVDDQTIRVKRFSSSNWHSQE